MLDAEVFERLVEEGRGLLTYDPSAAALVFAEALSLWRGRVLEEFTYESFAQAEIDRLDSLRIDAVAAERLEQVGHLRCDGNARRGCRRLRRG